MKNSYAKFLNVKTLTSVLFLFASLFVYGQNEKDLWANESFGQYDMTKEDLSKRSLNAKHLINSDGSN